jgi:arginyl-tRNA synthetase
MAKLIEEDGRFADPDDIAYQVKEYLQVKKTLDEMESRQKELREKLFAALDAEGLEDDKGNIQLELGEDINGIVRIEKQRRVSRKIDELKADDIIESNGLGDTVYVMTRTIDEDALRGAFDEGRITEDELDEMFPPKVTWALMTKKS